MPSGPYPEFDTPDEAEEWWVKTPDSDGWPDSLMPAGLLNRASLSTIMSDHFKAHGGKFRAVTIDALYDATGVDNVDHLKPDDFDKAARYLLRDAAKYRHGLKKPVTKAPAPAK